MRKLYQLANGNWIDPGQVSSINLVGPDAVRPYRIVIHGPDRQLQVVLCEPDDKESAEAMRDMIAKECNEARAM